MVETLLGKRWVRQPVQIDRVIVEPDDRKVIVVWGSRLDCGTKGRQVVKSVISTKLWARL